MVDVDSVFKAPPDAKTLKREKLAKLGLK